MGRAAEGRDRRRAAEEPVVAARARRGEARPDQGDAAALRDAGPSARGQAHSRGERDRRTAREVAAGQEKLRTETGQSRDRAARAARPRALGRDAAQTRRRARGHARALRLRARRRASATTTDAFCAPTWSCSLPGGKCIVVDSKVPIEGVPRRDQLRRRGPQARAPRPPRAAGARPHQEARPEAVLGPVRGRRRSSS